MNNSLEYWKKRCELAEKVIENQPKVDLLNFSELHEKSWQEWVKFKDSAEAVIEEDPNPILPYKVTTRLDHEHKIYAYSAKDAKEQTILSDIDSVYKVEPWREPEYIVDIMGAMVIPNTYIDNFRGKYPLVDIDKLKESEGNPLDNIDKCGLVESKQNLRFNFKSSQEPTIKGLHENPEILRKEFESITLDEVDEETLNILGVKEE